MKNLDWKLVLMMLIAIALSFVTPKFILSLICVLVLANMKVTMKLQSQVKDLSEATLKTLTALFHEKMSEELNPFEDPFMDSELEELLNEAIKDLNQHYDTRTGDPVCDDAPDREGSSDPI